MVYMNQTQLTIIVTNFNLQRFLPTCLDRLAQENPELVNVLVIDDGSTDESVALIRQYCTQYKNFRLHERQNGGLSRARNSGLDIAETSYVAFCDADDFVAPGYYTRLLERALADDLDVVMGNSKYHYQGDKPDRELYPADIPTSFKTGKDWLRYQLKQKNLLHMACMQVYRRQFIEKHQLRFVPDMIHEDVVWTTRYLLLAERFAYLPEAGYFYRIHRRNVVHSDQKLIRIIESSVFNAQTLDSFASMLLSDSDLKSLLSWQLVDGGLSIFHKLKKIVDKELKKKVTIDLRRNGIYFLLWRNAVCFSQRRRIARYWLISLFSL